MNLRLQAIDVLRGEQMAEPNIRKWERDRTSSLVQDI
jgi:hypothetical protein